MISGNHDFFLQNIHRRLIDEGVIFVIDPKRIDIGLITRFKDDDGNIIGAMEINQ